MDSSWKYGSFIYDISNCVCVWSFSILIKLEFGIWVMVFSTRPFNLCLYSRHIWSPTWVHGLSLFDLSIRICLWISLYSYHICILTWGFGLFTWPRTCVHSDTQQTHLESELRMWSLSLWSFNLCLWANFVLQWSHLNLEFMLWSISMWHFDMCYIVNTIGIWIEDVVLFLVIL